MLSRTLKRFLAVLLTIAPALAMSHGAQAQRLDEILKRGKILIGIDVNSPPYGFQDEKQQPTGQEVETAQLLAKDLGVQLEIVPTTVANRIPYLTTNCVDIIMATFAITPERAKSIWFSTPYGTTGSVVIGPKTVAVKDSASLSGKSIATTRGSAAELALNANAPKDTQIMRFDDDFGGDGGAHRRAVADARDDAGHRGDHLQALSRSQFRGKVLAPEVLVRRRRRARRKRSAAMDQHLHDVQHPERQHLAPQ